jgi:multiple sugar transport system substrate-binding protein
MQGKAANYVMGNFAVAVFKDGGMTNDTLGFMPFPKSPRTCRAARKRRPTRSTFRPVPRTSMTPSVPAFIATADVQTKLNEALGQLPINNQSKVGEDDPVPQAGFELLSTTPGGIAQFFDRDAPAEMAKIGMEGFQQFMVSPTTSTTSSSGSKKPASASTSKLMTGRPIIPAARSFRDDLTTGRGQVTLRPSPAHSGVPA